MLPSVAILFVAIFSNLLTSGSVSTVFPVWFFHCFFHLRLMASNFLLDLFVCRCRLLLRCRCSLLWWYPFKFFLQFPYFVFQFFLPHQIFGTAPCFAFQYFLLRNWFCFNQTSWTQFHKTTVGQLILTILGTAQQITRWAQCTTTLGQLTLTISGTAQQITRWAQCTTTLGQTPSLAVAASCFLGHCGAISTSIHVLDYNVDPSTLQHNILYFYWNTLCKV